MKMQISEIAKRTGVSVRTLHYYDSIGLLEPVEVDKTNGYRYYDESSVEKLSKILYYRGLDFPLRDIPSLLSGTKSVNQKLLAQRNLLLEESKKIGQQLQRIDMELAQPFAIEPWFDKVLKDYNYSGFAYMTGENACFCVWGMADPKAKTPFKLDSRFHIEGAVELFTAYCVLLLRDTDVISAEELSQTSHKESIEKATSLPLRDALRVMVFEPLEMFNTVFGGDVDIICDDAATFEEDTLVSTAEDISKFCDALLHGTLLSVNGCQRLISMVGGDADSGRLSYFWDVCGVSTELILDVEAQEFFLSVRNRAPIPDNNDRIMYYPIVGCDDGYVKLELWNMQSGSTAGVFSIKIFDEDAQELYCAPLPSAGYFIKARNDGDERNAEDFLTDSSYYYELELSEVLGKSYDSSKTYIIEAISHTESQSGAMLGAVYKHGGEWQNFAYYIFYQYESAYPLFMEALQHIRLTNE